MTRYAWDNERRGQPRAHLGAQSIFFASDGRAFKLLEMSLHVGLLTERGRALHLQSIEAFLAPENGGGKASEVWNVFHRGQTVC